MPTRPGKAHDPLIQVRFGFDMLRRIADGYGVRTADDLYTGFKWIGEKIDELGPERYVFGFDS